MTINKKLVSFFFISIFSVSWIFSADVANANKAKKFNNKVLAIVGDETILMSDFDKLAKPLLENYDKMTQNRASDEDKKRVKEEILEQMITEKLMLKEAEKQKITISRRQQDSAYEEIRARFPTEEQYKEELKKQELTEQQFKDKLLEQLKIMELINKEVRAKVVTPTDAEALKYYNENKALMREPEAVRARHILIKFKDGERESDLLKKIEDIKAELDKGADFRDLAKKYSDDKASAERGGDLGLFTRGQMVPEFESVAFSLNVGEVSKPVKTQFGYHLIRLEEKRLEQEKEFAEVKDTLKEFLSNQKAEEVYKNWIEKLKKSTNIVKNGF